MNEKPDPRDTRPPGDPGKDVIPEGPRQTSNGTFQEGEGGLEEVSRSDLSPGHLRALREVSGISQEVIEERGYFTASDPERLAELGFPERQRSTPALVIPVHRADGKKVFCRSRPDNPREDPARPARSIKYEQPAGTNVVLDVPPRVRGLRYKKDVRLWIVEGEKKADSLVSRGECAIGLLGVWSWKRNGYPLPDWDHFRISGREVHIAFDSDAERKVQVRLARSALAAYLAARGAKVKIIKLPDEADGSKQGVDDFLAAGNTVADLEGLSEPFIGNDVGDSNWPTMAEEAYHGLAGEVVRTIEPHTESDPAGLLATVLAEVGNAVGRGAHFVIEDDEHYCKIWAVLVGETGKARKGTGKKRIDRLMRTADDEWHEVCTVSGLSSGEGLIHRVRDPVIVDTDEGPEVKDPGAEDKRLLVEEPEFASVLVVARREGNTLGMVLRNAWDNRPLETLTKNSPMRATDSHVTVVGHVTERELLRHLTEEKLGAGIGNRFLFVSVRRSKVLPHGGGRDEFPGELLRRLRRAVDFGKRRREIPLSEKVEAYHGLSAVELWEEVYPDLSSGKPGLFGAVVARAEAYARRLATVYAVLDLSPEVRVPHLLAALALWQYSEASAHRIFGDRTGDALADELLEALRDAGETGMTRSEIYDLFGRNRRRNHLGAVLRGLKEQGRVRMEKEKQEGAGRPTERWFLVDTEQAGDTAN